MEDPEASGGREAIPEENAAVLEKLEKNGALQHSPERAELLIILLKNPGSSRLLTEESGLYVKKLAGSVEEPGVSAC